MSYSPHNVDPDVVFRCSSNSIRCDNTPPTLASLSKMTVGISGHSIKEDVHLGCQNNTLGYHSDSGVVISNHCSKSQTRSPKYSAGDTVGVLVTDFGKEKSSILIIKNGRPVCTKYHYEKDNSQFYPTITLEHGPVDLTVTWQSAVSSVPEYLHTNNSDWMVMPGFAYDLSTQTFCTQNSDYENYSNRLGLSSLQGPCPLSPERSYYEVELVKKSLQSQNPSLIISLISSGAHLCAPSSALYHEVLKFTINTKAAQPGDKFGWGLHYLFPIKDGNTLRQPVLCCVAINGLFQTSLCYLEPEGGYYPFIAFTAQDFRLKINTSRTRLPFNLLPIQMEEHLHVLTQLLDLEKKTRELLPSNLLYSSDLVVDICGDRLDLTLHKDVTGVQTLQYFGHALVKGRSVFQINVTRLTEDSTICVGVASRFNSTSKYPGRELSSLGYHSRDGKVLYDGRSQANTNGHRFTEGDQVMMEVYPLPKSSQSVMVRIWKNELPIALRYLNVQGGIDLYPTVSLFANGFTVRCEMITPNMIEQLPTYFVNNPLYWCLPSNAHVVNGSTEVYIRNQAATGHCIVCPVPMSRGMHHFEVKVLAEPTDPGIVPPMIALTTASPYDPPRESNFQLDLLRFWPRDEAATLVRKGDTMGWGVIFPDDDLSDLEEQIVICYLTINRDVILTRALIQPAGGLHATVIFPYGCERVRLDFDALTIYSHPFTRSNVQQLYMEAQQIVKEEKQYIASGIELPFEHQRLQDYYKPLPTDGSGDLTPHRLGGLYDTGVHTADHLAIHKSRSKACILL